MKSTIKDVANRANVSIATVSRYLNHSGYVNSDTAKNIKDAIKQLDYRPPKHAFKRENSTIIKVILPSITNPLYAEFYEEILVKLAKTPYTAILEISNLDHPNIDPYLKQLKENKIAGIITSSPLEISPKDASVHLPIVSFDRHINKVCLIHCNNLDGGYKIAARVLSLGKKNILILAGSHNDFYPINNRIRGMLTVFNHYKVKVQNSYLDFDNSITAKKIQIAQILDDEKFDAICCTDDITATLVKNYTDKLDYHPIITGFDGTEFIHSIFPDLITVKQPIKDIADLCCDVLIQKIEHPSKIVQDQYLFPVTLLN